MITPTADVGTSIARQFAQASRSTAWIVVLCLILGTLLVGYQVLRRQMVNHTIAVAELMALQAEAAVLFEDELNAHEIVSTMGLTANLRMARLKSNKGVVLASFDATPDYLLAMTESLSRPPVIRRPVTSDGVVIGQLEIMASNAPLLAALGGLSVAVVVVALLLAAVSLLLARRFARRVVKPLRTLQDTMRQIIDKGDYHARAPRFPIEEVEQLRAEFDELLSELARRDQAIKDSNSVLERLAFHDALTQLPNRAMYERAWLDAITEARDQGTPVGLIYIDLDDFKSVNDTHGHDAGDAMLVSVAQRLRSWQRSGTLAARLGGDEFIVLLRPAPCEEEIIAMVDTLRRQLEQPLRFGTTTLTPKVSLGWARHPGTVPGLEELTVSADHAMYQNKAQRRGNTTALRSAARI